MTREFVIRSDQLGEDEWGKILRKAVSDDGRCEGEKDGGRGRQDTAECGGRVDRGDQEGEESARSEVRRGGAAQMSKLVFKWARREDGVQGQGGRAGVCAVQWES